MKLNFFKIKIKNFQFKKKFVKKKHKKNIFSKLLCFIWKFIGNWNLCIEKNFTENWNPCVRGHKEKNTKNFIYKKQMKKNGNSKMPKH